MFRTEISFKHHTKIQDEITLTVMCIHLPPTSKHKIHVMA